MTVTNKDDVTLPALEFKMIDGKLNVDEPKCLEHPSYKAIRKPRRTNKHPEGCLACGVVYARRHMK